jgi:hypothetical protein
MSNMARTDPKKPWRRVMWLCLLQPGLSNMLSLYVLGSRKRNTCNPGCPGTEIRKIMV